MKILNVMLVASLMLGVAGAHEWEKHKAEYAKRDKALNQVCGELPEELPEGLVEVTSERQEARTWLTMRHHVDGGPRIRIVGADPQPFHGSRASFDGSYLRVGLLDAKGQAEVMEIAKRGGSPA